MFNKGRSGVKNPKMSMSDSSPGVDHRRKSGEIIGEEIHADLNQIHASSEDVERPTVRSMKTFFETMAKAESTKKSAFKIGSDEEGLLLNVKRSRVRYCSPISPSQLLGH
jgi:hypothetical protein